MSAETSPVPSLGPFLGPSGHVDDFTRRNLPPFDQWPELILDRPEFFPQNADGKVLDMPGGARHRVEMKLLRYMEGAGALDLAVVDEAGRPLDARVSVTSADGRSWAPDSALMHADDSFDRSERRFEVGVGCVDHHGRRAEQPRDAREACAQIGGDVRGGREQPPAPRQRFRGGIVDLGPREAGGRTDIAVIEVVVNRLDPADEARQDLGAEIDVAP